jgi:hypothetical protein
LFDLNICMEIQSEEDFPRLREQILIWRKRFPMFRHDVNQIENIIEIHIQNHSIALVFYRQTKKKKFLEDAQREIDGINRILSTVSKLELMAILSQS